MVTVSLCLWAPMGGSPPLRFLLEVLIGPRLCAGKVSQCMRLIYDGDQVVTCSTTMYSIVCWTVFVAKPSATFILACQVTAGRLLESGMGGLHLYGDDFSNLYGFSYLTGCDKQKVLTGNHLLKCTFKLALACFEHGIPGSIENPSTSRAWLTREMRSLVHRGATFQLVHYCQYGKLWKKATNFLTWLSPDFRFRQCAGKHGACSATQQFHVLLQGKNAQGIFKTLIAQPYPVSMVNSIAHTLRASLWVYLRCRGGGSFSLSFFNSCSWDLPVRRRSWPTHSPFLFQLPRTLDLLRQAAWQKCHAYAGLGESATWIMIVFWML